MTQSVAYATSGVAGAAGRRHPIAGSIRSFGHSSEGTKFDVWPAGQVTPCELKQPTHNRR